MCGTKYIYMFAYNWSNWLANNHQSTVWIAVIILVLTQLTQTAIANNIGNLIYIKLLLVFDIVILTNGNTLNVTCRLFNINIRLSTIKIAISIFALLNISLHDLTFD